MGSFPGKDNNIWFMFLANLQGATAPARRMA
jgi:hypothetical protein